MDIMVASLTLPKVSTVSDLAFNIASVLANSVLKDSSFKPLPYVYHHNIVYIYYDIKFVQEDVWQTLITSCYKKLFDSLKKSLKLYHI